MYNGGLSYSSVIYPLICSFIYIFIQSFTHLPIQLFNNIVKNNARKKKILHGSINLVSLNNLYIRHVHRSTIPEVGISNNALAISDCDLF